MSKDRNLQLQDLLSDMASEGELVSSAADFTVHHSKAEEKLKKFQLSNPHFYVLKLVQSAILSGAREVKVECHAHQVSFEHDGRPPAPTELKGLLNHLFLSQEERAPWRRALQRLASAVNTAVAAHARELTIQCHDEAGSYQQSWTADGTQFKKLEVRNTRGVRFFLSRKSDDVASSLRHIGNTRLIDLAKGHRSSIQKEEAALWDRCIFSPIPIEVNQEQINRHHFGYPRYPNGERDQRKKVPWFHWVSNRDHYYGRVCHKRYHLIQAYHRAESSVETHLLAPTTANSFLISKAHPHQSGAPCAMILGLESSREFANRVNYVKEGVIIEQDTPNLSVTGLFALISAHELNTDLSGFKLSRGEDYLRLSEKIQAAVNDLVGEYQERADEIPFLTRALAR